MIGKSMKVIYCNNCKKFYAKVISNTCPKCKEFHISIAIFSISKYDNISILLDAPYNNSVDVDYLDNEVASGKLKIKGVKK